MAIWSPVEPKFYIATVWRFNEESGWTRSVRRGRATSRAVFKAGIVIESADDKIDIGTISESKDQESQSWERIV